MPKLLIVDDDESMVKIFGDVLRAEGFHVITARNGLDGANLAAEKLPDLILLDVMMPGIDGCDMAFKLSQNTKTSKIPIVFITSLVAENEMGNIGGDTSDKIYISKSVNKKELVKTIKEVLEKSKS